MTARAFDPRSVDIAAFAKQGGGESGSVALIALDRLCGEAHPEAKPAASESVEWRATGESRARRGGAPEVWLHLEGRTQLSLVCQRCLQPVGTALHAQRGFQFVAGEDQAAAIDADSEDDVLALTRTLNLIELLEDELLLVLPLVPLHDVCPRPLMVREDDSILEERINPFAVLGGLKRKSPSS
ncbi:MAG: YceD family protein [Pseudomonadota bacterium]|nr:YceD family protein [Pseudomonadota bacterium]